MITLSVNFLAIILAAVANMVLGTLWYGPVFGKYWMRLAGITKPEVIDAKMKKQMIVSYLINFVSTIITAFILAFLLQHSPVVLVSLIFAFFLWLGFVATFSLGSVLWEGKSWKLYLLNNGYNLVSLLLTAAIVTFWR